MGPPPCSTLFPYTTLFRSPRQVSAPFSEYWVPWPGRSSRSEEHTSELQSRFDLVCRLLLEKKIRDTERDLVEHVQRIHAGLEPYTLADLNVFDERSVRGVI